MQPRPISENPYATSSQKLKDKVAIITGGDSGIGRAVAYLFAREGADIVIAYLDEHMDAKETQQHILELGARLYPCSRRLKRKKKWQVKSYVEHLIALDKSIFLSIITRFNS